MSMTKDELKNAFREAASYEFHDIPCDDSLIQHEFSPEFEQKMEKLIRQEHSFFWHFINTTSKRIAVFAVVFIMLFTTACSVDSIREPIVHFLITIYETFTEYTFEGENSEMITQEYQITSIPTGFIQTDCFKDDTGIVTTYENELGDKIRFSQTITAQTDITVDIEHAETEIVDVSGREVQLYLRENISVAFWIENNYLLKIVCHGNFNAEDIIDIINTIE